MRKIFSMVLIFVVTGLVSGAVLGQELKEQQQSEQPASQQSEEALARVAALRTAASQYEIIDVLLAEGRYAEIVPEFSVITDLGWRGNDQLLLAKAAWEFSVKLREQGQFEVAHQIIDQALGAVDLAEGRYSLLMMRGKIYKDQHRYGEAIQALREAQKLGVPTPPESNSPERLRVPQG